jgi:hypothetical protein
MKKKGKTTFKSDVRIFASTDGNTGRSQLFFNCTEYIQKQFAGKRVKIELIATQEAPK